MGVNLKKVNRYLEFVTERIKSDHYISEKRNSPTVVEYFLYIAQF